jgi:hypothetical protein
LQLQHFHQVGVLRSFLKHRLCQLLIRYFSYPQLYAVTMCSWLLDLPHCGSTKLSLKVKLEPKENTSDPVYSSVTKHEYALSNEEICLSTIECTCSLCLKLSWKTTTLRYTAEQQSVILNLISQAFHELQITTTKKSKCRNLISFWKS